MDTAVGSVCFTTLYVEQGLLFRQWILTAYCLLHRLVLPLQMVCQGTGAADERIRISSFTCLHEIAANYYSKLPAYMGEIFNISVKAIQEDTEEVGLQAVEFWSTLCDIELDMADEDDPAEVGLMTYLNVLLVMVALSRGMNFGSGWC